MFYPDSLFSAVSPSKPVAVFINYQPLLRNEQLTFPVGVIIHEFTVNGDL